MRGCVKLEPLIFANKATGAILFQLFVQGSGVRQFAAVHKAAGDSWVLERLSSPEGVLLLCRAATFGQAIEAQRRVADLKNIDYVECIVADDGAYAIEKLRSICAEQVHLAPG